MKGVAAVKVAKVRKSVMANRSDRDPPSLYGFLDFESFKEMRRGSTDSIRASRYLPASQAAFKTAAYLSQHTNSSLQTGGVHIKTMQIAVTSQNRKTITEHAGQCRKFWIYDVEQGVVVGKRLIELSKEQSFHASHHELTAPLAGINVLITASMGSGLHQRLTQSGILPFVTQENDPDTAVSALLANKLENMPIAPDHHCHGHGHDHEHTEH
ncbi:MAG: NifB/NifX family molybdenum-iron cluster-binding protein [Candidatus Dechloromonas phosphoritropha]